MRLFRILLVVWTTGGIALAATTSGPLLSRHATLVRRVSSRSRDGSVESGAGTKRQASSSVSGGGVSKRRRSKSPGGGGGTPPGRPPGGPTISQKHRDAEAAAKASRAQAHQAFGTANQLIKDGASPEAQKTALGDLAQKRKDLSGSYRDAAVAAKAAGDKDRMRINRLKSMSAAAGSNVAVADVNLVHQDAYNPDNSGQAIRTSRKATKKYWESRRFGGKDSDSGSQSSAPMSSDSEFDSE